MKKKYNVIIEEIVSQNFEVEAESLEDALMIASNKYHTGIFVLEPGELESVTAMAEDEETKEETNWIDI